jgi:hypothetical protein
MTLERTCTRCFSTFFTSYKPEETKQAPGPRTRIEVLCDACFAKALTEIIEAHKKTQQEKQRE